LKPKIAQAEKDVALAKKNKTTAPCLPLFLGCLQQAGNNYFLTSPKNFLHGAWHSTSYSLPLFSLVKIFKAKEAIALGENTEEGFR